MVYSAGIGNGFGYSTVVPVMAKWFPDRIGLATGLALAGYGGGSAIFGTLANLVFFPHFGWRASCMMLGGIFLVMTMAGALLLKNPETKRPHACRQAYFYFQRPALRSC